MTETPAGSAPHCQIVRCQIFQGHDGSIMPTAPVGPVLTIVVLPAEYELSIFFLGGPLGIGNIAIPPMTTTITGEDFSSSGP
jgi:hypothetical protein